MDTIGKVTLETDIVHLLAKEQVWHYQVLPKTVSAESLELYCEQGKGSASLIAELEIVLNKKVKLTPLPAGEIIRLMATYYQKEKDANDSAFITPNLVDDDFLVTLIKEAKSLKSSDIHIERYEDKCRARFRIDGVLVERYILKGDDYPALINKIKIAADLDIAQKRLPQDGRINFSREEFKFDIRVSVLPALYGEKAVLRLLNNDATNIDLNSLGFSGNDLDNYLQGVKRPNGILLISGPTGSGKTTTLYATLKLLNKTNRNILTIEDPIEYTLEGVNQVQLKENIGFTFPMALKTFMRQDPDIIMVGEIRDVETANMAIRAALTGHLVLSTIHTNSAWGTISRLIDMGIPSYLLSDTLNTTVAQRLIRLLCPACKKKMDFDVSLFPKQFKPEKEINYHYGPVGCEKCYFTGFKGRKAIYEVIPMDYELSNEIKKGNLDVRKLLKARGIQTLAANALQVFTDGLTSMEEIFPMLFNN
ncbi:GspE/PulE family protein [Mucilaginibacter sp.]|uniref:GspE/PulE family protein n=1 Tax=Mucilaginibacter sp. TaxID=1882438 RepID=UPI0025F6325F|nr:GspE/PulE family protein [Mucilaginibacter sp.]